MAREPTDYRALRNEQALAPEHRVDSAEKEPTRPEANQRSSPSWTEHGSMASQQASAIAYNNWLNQSHAARDQSAALTDKQIEDARSGPGGPQKAEQPAPELKITDPGNRPDQDRDSPQTTLATNQPDSRPELPSRIDLLQREAERTSEHPDVLRGSRQLFDIDQRRLDRRMAADPANAAEIRTEKEARAQEYVGYLTDMIGHHLERDGRHDQAANMHHEAEARREIAGQLHSAMPVTSSPDEMIDDPGRPQRTNFAQESVPGVDANAHTADGPGRVSPGTGARRPGHYADLEATHAKVASMYDPGDDASAERGIARTNSEIISRQQVEVAISTGGAAPPDAALTREDIRAELKSMAADAAKRADGPERDDTGQRGLDTPGRPSPGRGGVDP